MAPDRRDALRTLADRASEQHGVFTRRQAVEAGLTRGAINHRVQTGAWVVVDYAVYRSAETAPSWKQRLMAACLAGPAVASHRAAAALWDAPLIRDQLVEVTAVRHLRRHTGDVLWHESRHLGERHVTRLDGIPVTRPVRTVVDLGSVLDLETLIVIYDDFARRKLVDRARVARLVESFGPQRIGATTLTRLLDVRRRGDALIESVLESKFDEIARAAGLPRFVRQFAVRDPAGRVLGRVDFALPQERIAIEVDGRRYHDPDADRRRDRAMHEAGWRVLRFPYADVVGRPERVVAVIVAACNGSAYLSQE